MIHQGKGEVCHGPAISLREYSLSVDAEHGKGVEERPAALALTRDCQEW